MTNNNGTTIIPESINSATSNKPSINPVNLLRAISASRYQSSKSLSELRIVMQLCEQLEQLLSLPAGSLNLVRGQYVTIKKQLGVHKASVARRIKYVERNNARSASSYNKQKRLTALAELLADVAPDLVSGRTIERRQTDIDNKNHAESIRAASVSAIKQELEAAGVSPNQTFGEREQWIRDNETAKAGMPVGVDLQSQADRMFQLMQDAERERETLLGTNTESKSGDNSND